MLLLLFIDADTGIKKCLNVTWKVMQWEVSLIGQDSYPHLSTADDPPKLSTALTDLSVFTLLAKK